MIVPANGSLPNIVLSPRTFRRIRRALERERFDVLHLHEPMTPVICTSTLVLARTPIVATFHASGELGWMRFGAPLWGFLSTASTTGSPSPSARGTRRRGGCPASTT